MALLIPQGSLPLLEKQAASSQLQLWPPPTQLPNVSHGRSFEVLGASNPIEVIRRDTRRCASSLVAGQDLELFEPKLYLGLKLYLYSLL